MTPVASHIQSSFGTYPSLKRRLFASVSVGVVVLHHAQAFSAGLVDFQFGCCALGLFNEKRPADHMTPVLASLHWLPLTSMTDFKILLLVCMVPRG